MTPRVNDDVVRRVIELAEMDENPLGVPDALTTGADAMVDAVHSALAGMDGTTAARVAGALTRLLSARTDPTCDLDRITARLLVHAGIDPLAVAWLSAACDGVTVTDDDDMDESVTVDADIRPHESTLCETVTRIGDHAWWKAGGVLLIKDVPAATVTAAVGRKLRDVVSHPVLDAHEIVVAAADIERDGCPAELECHLPPMTATPEWLLTCMPRKDHA